MFINLTLAMWLMVSPWVAGFAHVHPAAANAGASGAVVGVVATAVLLDHVQWGWINDMLGLWLALAPWVLGFATTPAATSVHVVTGLAVALVAAVELWKRHHSPPQALA